MGRKSAVEKLPDTEFDFVVKQILDGLTDREISAQFEKQFKKKLPKTNLNRWRKNAGNELAERYRLKRFQVRSFVEQLKTQGIEVNQDKYKNIIENLEDHLLTSERELISENPAKLLLARQREENIRLRRDQLALKKEELDFEREKFERTQNLQADRFKIGSGTWTYILKYFLENDPSLADGLTKHSEALLDGLGEHIEQL